MVFPNKMKKTIVKPLSERNFEFIGNHQNNSILVGNYGDAKIKAIGNFNLSGLIYCRQSTVEINMAGRGGAPHQRTHKQIDILSRGRKICARRSPKAVPAPPAGTVIA